LLGLTQTYLTDPAGSQFSNSFLELDLKQFLNQHSLEAQFFSDKVYEKDGNAPAFNRSLKVAKHALARVFPMIEKNKWKERLGVARAVGGRDADWTPERRAEFLGLYEDVLQKVRAKSPELPEHVKEALSHPKVAAHEVARDYAAELLGIPQNSYLRRVITDARRERRTVTRR